MSIVPVWAQYSFEKVIGQSGWDWPYGMKQASDGYFYLFGQASGSTTFSDTKNYIAKIDHLGNIIWQRTFTEKSRVDYISDLVELADGRLFFGGYAQEQLQEGNARVCIMNASGEILFDSIYPIRSDQSGSIVRMCENKEKGYVVSIGGGASNNTTLAYMFQITDYNGKRLWYKFFNAPEDYFGLKKIFKRKDKNEYIVFGEKKLIRLDSIGNLLDTFSWAIGPYEGASLHEINDVVQNDDGTFTCLVKRSATGVGGCYLQLNDELGQFSSYKTKISSNSGAVLTKTKDKGYFVAGGYFTLIDSNEQVVWDKRSTQPEASTDVNVGQSTDGCFYGCAVDKSKNSSNDYDIYIFKTTVDGVIKSGINDIYKYTLKAQVMPNPSAGLFIITGEFNQAQVCITNLLGQQVLHSQGIIQGDKLDASELNNGIYIITLTEDDNTYVQKINIIK